VIFEREELERAAADPVVAGVVIWQTGGEKNTAALQGLRDRGKAVIFVDRRPPAGFDADYAGCENRGAAAAVVRHLLRLGHKVIAHLTYQENTSTVLDRADGYRRALVEYRIPFQEDLQQMAVWTTEGYKPKLTDILRTWCAVDRPGGPVTAVFTVNDVVARQVIEAAEAIGLKVPEDLSVAGFDGVDLNDPNPQYPLLTTAAQPWEQVGKEAGYLITERIESKGAITFARHLLVQAPLVKGESSAPPPPL
jgi:DNA-binding LacI/PurR family transcriptional regulator